VREHVPEQFDVVAVLVRLAVGIGAAQDKCSGVRPAVALPGLVERVPEGVVRQVFCQVAVLLKVRNATI
jgi:hypothetical protein